MGVEVTHDYALNALPRLARIRRLKLPPKGAHWVGRLLDWLESEASAVNKTMVALLREHGGVVNGDSISLVEPKKPEIGMLETAGAFAERMAQYEAARALYDENHKKFTEAYQQVLDEKTEWQFDPIPIEHFEVTELDAKRERVVMSTIEPEDMRHLLAFVKT